MQKWGRMPTLRRRCDTIAAIPFKDCAQAFRVVSSHDLDRIDDKLPHRANDVSLPSLPKLKTAARSLTLTLVFRPLSILAVLECTCVSSAKFLSA